LLKPEHVQIITSTFITVFMAEIGDKTQLTTLMITAESGSPLIVFLGAAIALISTSFLGVVAGKWLANHLSPRVLKLITGVSFMFLAIGLAWDAVI
jgi:putative Ca2+/H+ antiporter (TMEM165/GDT1 family)